MKEQTTTPEASRYHLVPRGHRPGEELLKVFALSHPWTRFSLTRAEVLTIISNKRLEKLETLAVRNGLGVNSWVKKSATRRLDVDLFGRKTGRRA